MTTNVDFDAIELAREEKMKPVLDRSLPGYGLYMQFQSGWDDLVLKLDQNLSRIDPEYKVSQMKEKFGGLRYYCDSFERLSDKDSERFRNLIRQAEDDSYKICEICGIKDNTVSLVGANYWYRTRCAKCRK